MTTNGQTYQLPPQTDDELTVTADGGGTDYPECPAGAWAGRCVDVVYRGKQENKFDPTKPPQHKISLHLMVEAYNEEEDTPARRTDGKRFVLSAWFTRSMHAKASLRKTLAAWRGKDFDDEQAETFNLNDLVGKDCLVNVKIVKGKDGEPKAVIDSIGRLPRGMQPCGEEEYIRARDRKPEAAGSVNAPARSPGQWSDVPPPDDQYADFQPAGAEDEDDLPF